MNKKLQKIADTGKKVIEERNAERAKLLENVAAAEADLQKAEADKQAATDAEAYADAAERGRRAADMVDFHQGALSRLESNSITQAEYDDSKAVIKSCAEDAAAAFRKRVEGIAAQLVTAYNEYAQATEECNEAAKALDDAAGILQAEYGVHWEQHALRFTISDQHELFLGKKKSFGGGYIGEFDQVRVRTWNLLAALMGWKN